MRGKPGCQGCLSPWDWQHDADCPMVAKVKRKRRLRALPKCQECKSQARYELEGRTLTIIEMHACTCSRSEYQRTLRACAASPGGHKVEAISAGSHSFERCRKCGHHV